MSQNLNNGSSTHRDYGATSSSNTNMMSSSTTIPDVNFSGFSPTEFMSLSEDIAHNIQAVNSSSKQLEKILQILGTPRDQQSTRDKVHDINIKTNSRIEATSVDLQRLTAIVRRGDKQQKLQLEKLTNDFCSVVERYTTTQKRMAQAMRQTYTQPQMAQMQDDREADTEELIQRQQQLQQQKLQFEHDMLVDRERQMKQIEADILDVNKIMRTITALVQAQGEEVERIETNIENTASEVELGRDELAKAAGRRQSYRRKILILLAIAVIANMLFENPAVAAKLPFPYNVPPPLQAAAAAAAVPNLRFQTPIKAFACLTTPSNPIDNAAAAAAAAAAGLIDPHNRDLRNALVASMNGNVAAATINGSLTTAAVLKSASAAAAVAAAQQQQTNANNVSQQQQQQQQNMSTANSNTVSQQQQQQQQQQHTQAQQAALAILNGSSANNANNNNNPNDSTVKTSLSGRSTPNNSVNGSSGTDPAPGKLFVGGLSWQTSSEKLKEYFNMFGAVTDVLIMKDPLTQRSRGFGFITFKEPGSVDKVLQVPIHTLDGKKIDPKHATPKNRPRNSSKTKKIFVGGVAQDTSAEEVKAYFNQFGTVGETVMLMDQQTKRHRGFGFVTFENEDVVDRVCEIHFHTIKNKKVECKKAQPKEVVTPAAQLLQKRIMLGTLAPGQLLGAAPGQLLGARTAAGLTAMNPLAMLQNHQGQLQFHATTPQAAAAAQQAALISQNPFQVQNAAAAAVAANPSGFGKLLTYPQAALHSVRYTPYPIPATAAAANAFAQAQQQQQQQVANVAHHHHHQQQQNAVAAAAQQHTAAAQNSAVAAAATQAHNAAALAAAGTTPATGAHAAASAVTNPLAAAAAQQAALVATNPLNAATNPYQSYALANVDMSSFQGVDWSSVYGMGMYV